jgi:ABC-2 type transport system ATP-binding protein
VTIGLCTHDMAEAASLADDVAIISDGQCRGLAPIEELLASGEESVTFSAALNLDTHGLQTALPEGHRVEESHPGQYRIAGPVGPQTLATVSAWCGQMGVRPRDLRIAHRDLEDVYWEMTGSQWTAKEDTA